MDVPAGFEDLFDDGVRAFLALATTRPSGDPVVVPVWFVSDAQGLVFSTGTDAWKAHDMRARPSVAGMVMAEGEHERYVSVRGTAHEVLDPEAEGIDRQHRSAL
jgi:pyridoxine/pyridoxamine 5'-phosphate oxidase